MAHEATQLERQILEAQKRLEDHKAFVERMILQGALTQAAADRLRQLERTLSRMKKQRRPTRQPTIVSVALALLTIGV
jgi:hypothetical protein